MRYAVLAASLLLLAGCADKRPTNLSVDMYDRSGDKLGVIKLAEQSDSLEVDIDVKGLSPGNHAIHFHSKGVCKGPDFKSAGNHFNPDSKEHGLLNDKGPHTGDLPNITADEEGKVKVKLKSSATLKNDRNSLLTTDGTSIVIHAKADNGMTQPAGDSGEREACGVVSKDKRK
ncbi:superoxide dismutase family protein [Bacillus sp. 1P06AnD]|uniref:superoxide dismutase family protein n=1 Tax=Bacillus sp. 1P06AnD TaxID=3132208 RepID=UPI0039A0CC1C